jgi:hypothetical protein
LGSHSALLLLVAAVPLLLAVVLVHACTLFQSLTASVVARATNTLSAADQ